MTESLHAYVLRQLAAHKGQWPRIAEETDMSLRTIEKIARQEVVDPGVSKVERLARFFRADELAASKQ